MSGRIDLVRDDDSLTPLEERPYDTEDQLQTLLERYPDLLAGEQMDENSPRRWLLIAREMGIPDQEGGGGRSIISSSIKRGLRWCVNILSC
jgi:hypothetical protein